MGEKLKQSFDALIGKLEQYANSKTVVGEPITFGNVVIVPLVEVSFAAGAGGGSSEKSGEGGGIGAKISPSAVLVVVNDTVQLVNVKDQDSVNKLIDLVPGVLAKLSSFLTKDKKDEQKDGKPGDKNDPVPPPSEEKSFTL